MPKARRERVLEAAREILADPAACEAQRPSVAYDEPEFEPEDADDCSE